MGKVLLIEDVHTFTPKPETIKNLSEQRNIAGGYKFPVCIDGRLSECDTVNDNKRRYRKPVWDKNLKEDSQLRQLIRCRRSVGLLEHPKDGQVTLLSPISHVLMDVRMEGNEIWGTLGFINTGEGLKMLALVEAGFNPLVSSRGYGSVVRSSDGIDEVQDDYVCEGWDVVWNPSFKNAELNAQKFREQYKESVTGSSEVFSAVNRWITEGKIKGNVKLEGGVVFVTSELTEGVVTFPAADGLNKVSGTEPLKIDSKIIESVKPGPTKTTRNMSHEKFRSIRESLTPIKALDLAKVEPRSLVETFAICADLHRDVATTAGSDATLSWDAQSLHTEIAAEEKRLSDAMTTPGRKVGELNELGVKLTKTLKVVSEMAVKYKKIAGVALKEASDKSAKLKETLENGHGWVARAQKAESANKVLEKKYAYACESVDEARSKYTADTTALARRVMQLECKDKLADPAIAKLVTEATTVEELIAIREGFEGKAAEKFTKASGKDAPGEPKFGKSKDKLKDKKDDKDEEGKTCESEEESSVDRFLTAPAEVKTEPKTEVKTEAKVEPKVEAKEPKKLTEDIPSPKPTAPVVEQVLFTPRRLFSIDECAASAKRMSTATRG